MADQLGIDVCSEEVLFSTLLEIWLLVLAGYVPGACHDAQLSRAQLHLGFSRLQWRGLRGYGARTVGRVVQALL